MEDLCLLGGGRLGSECVKMLDGLHLDLGRESELTYFHYCEDHLSS